VTPARTWKTPDGQPVFLVAAVDRALDKVCAGLTQRTTIRGVRVVVGEHVKWKCPCCGTSGSVIGNVELMRSCLISFVTRHQACWGVGDTMQP